MTSPGLVQLKCPQCVATHWELVFDQKEWDEDVEYENRDYKCPNCNYLKAGYRVLQRFPSEFLMRLQATLAKPEFDHWMNILKSEFNDNPHFFCQDQKTRENLIHVPLENFQLTLHGANTKDDWFSQEVKFYVGVCGKKEKNKLISDFQNFSKIASRQVMDLVIGSALPGIDLIYQNAPDFLFYKYNGNCDYELYIARNFEFFLLNPQSMYWDVVKRDKNICFRMLDIIPELELIFFADFTLRKKD